VGPCPTETVPSSRTYSGGAGPHPTGAAASGDAPAVKNADSAFVAFIEDAGNRLLRLDPETLARLGRLHGKVIHFEFSDLKRGLYVFPSEAGVRLRAAHDGEPHLSLIGPLTAFAHLAWRRDAATLNSGELTLRGDVALAQDVQRLLAAVDIDWEEQAARLIGDVAAHELGRLLRAADAWRRRALDVLGRDLAEYLQEEGRHLPRRDELDGFLTAVDVLRSDVDRLAQRVARLKAHGD